MTRWSILILVVGMILAAGCRRQPERTPDAHFSSVGGGLPVTLGETPSKDLLQSAASMAVASAEEPEEAAVEEEPIEEEEDAEETVAAPPAPKPAKPNKPKRREYDPNDPVNQTISPGFAPRG